MARGARSGLLLVAGALAVALGFAVGTIGGSYLLRWLLEATGASSGWEDLAALAGSAFTFGPLGAVIVLALLRRPSLEADQRRWLAAALFTSLAAGVVTWFAGGEVWALAVFLWAATLALAVWALSPDRR